MAESCLLVGDIGGTNARFAIADTGKPGFSGEKSFECADFESTSDAIHAYLSEFDVSQLKGICLAAAGPVVDNRIRVTNNHWSIDHGDIRREFDTPLVRLLNDFEAVAYSIVLLEGADLLPVGSPAGHKLSEAEFNIAVIGPGTGLGGAGLCKRQGTHFPIVAELGHVGFAPASDIQSEVMGLLAERFGRVSNERLLSGPGVENIYWAIAHINGGNLAEKSAAEVFSSAADKTDPVAEQALQMFFEVLGQVAGDMVLMLGATGGAYIAGGIVQRYPEMLAASNFRQGFEAKGRHRSIMETIPTQLVMHPQPGLLGASYCALELLAQ